MVSFDPFTDDPIFDQEYPASQATFPIDSHGSNLNAILEIAQGKGPHPTIILLHGFPGNEKNFDLAHIFRRAGYNVLIFYYRGSWGSGGNYCFQNCIDDVVSVLNHIREPTTAITHRIDTKNIILIGHSWGGFVALFAGVIDPRITKIASISGFNIGKFGKWLEKNKDPDTELYELFDNLGGLQGTSGKLLLNEIHTKHGLWDLEDLAEKITKKDVCLTGAVNDEVLPMKFHHTPLVNSITEISKHNLTTKTFSTSHSYSDNRLALAKFLLKWLNEYKFMK
ncbi:MAG: alpha/beta hydrolase [Candidatus Heimdallarchaeota archaeon]|nr:alpha/beta hydrolase [Candidatus Heimdallarchaeota archaeon]